MSYIIIAGTVGDTHFPVEMVFFPPKLLKFCPRDQSSLQENARNEVFGSIAADFGVGYERLHNKKYVHLLSLYFASVFLVGTEVTYLMRWKE